MIRFAIVVFCFVIISNALFSGCGSDENSGENSVVMFSLPGDLSEIDISYIPYDYTADGCGHRAIFLGMELAASGVPSGAVMVRSCDWGKNLEWQETKWSAHITTILNIGHNQYVIDPLVSSDFLEKEEWLSAINGEENTNIYINSSAYPSNGYDFPICNIEKVNENIPLEVQEMVPYYIENILISCSYLRAFLLKSDSFSEERDEKLVNRTYELIEELKILGLIENSYDEEIWDILKDGPWCPEPVDLP